MSTYSVLVNNFTTIIKLDSGISQANIVMTMKLIGLKLQYFDKNGEEYISFV